MYETISLVIEILYNFKDMVIKQPNKDIKRKKIIENYRHKNFLSSIEKINDTDIILKNILGGV